MTTAPQRLISRALAVATAGALALAASAVALPADAGSADYRLDRASVAGSGAHPVVRWNPCQREITYKVNLRYAGSSTTARESALRDVKGAVARVEAATGINFTYEGRTTQIPRNTSGSSWWQRQTSTEVVIAWVRQSSSSGRTNLLGRSSYGGYAAGTGGYVYKYYVSGGKYVAPIGRGYVVLDSAQRAKFRPGFGSGVTRGALLLHEIGHVMGLQHVGADSEIMYPTILSRARAYYRAGDQTGLARVGERAGCIRVPSSVWNAV